MISINLNAKIHKKVNTDDFLNDLLDRCYSEMKKDIKPLKKIDKIEGELTIIPKFNQYNMLCQYNYNVQQLKSLAKIYKLKITGNKPQLLSRIYSFLFLSNSVIKIQKILRGHLQRKYNNLHGPASKNRENCINSSDFYSMDDLKDIPLCQFFSYKDEDGFIYGFDLVSIHNLIYKCNGAIKNPYNRIAISAKVIENFRSLLRLSRVLKIPICIDVKDINAEITSKKSFK